MREKEREDNYSHLGEEAISDSTIAITETDEAVKTDLPWFSEGLSPTAVAVISDGLKNMGRKYVMILL